MDLVVAFVVSFVGFFVIRYFALSKDSSFLHACSVIFVLGIWLGDIIYGVQFDFIHPFEKEKITQGFVAGNGNLKGAGHFRKFIYTVDGQEYEGGFGLYNEYCRLYEPGDTIDVTYNEEDPSKSIATYQQYWYVNKEKEIYWLKIKHQEGRVNRYR